MKKAMLPFFEHVIVSQTCSFSRLWLNAFYHLACLQHLLWCWQARTPARPRVSPRWGMGALCQTQPTWAKSPLHTLELRGTAKKKKKSKCQQLLFLGSGPVSPESPWSMGLCSSRQHPVTAASAWHFQMHPSSHLYCISACMLFKFYKSRRG